jgi:hypothetical protein
MAIAVPTPAASDTTPIQMPPKGMSPPQVIEKRLMMRPRLSSSARCWSTELIVVVIEK